MNFDQYLYHRFLNRHADIVKTGKCPSLDEERGDLEWETFEQYFAHVEEALRRLTDLRLLLNMDESGFGTRPDKGKRKKCVFCLDIETTPVWKAATDNYHIS